MSKNVELIGGVQVSVETGTATIVGLEAKARNVEVRLEDPALAGKLRFPLKGWLDKADAGALALAERVKGTGVLVSYRIESHRDSKVDPSMPIADVPQTSRFRRLVSLTEAAATSANGTQLPEPAPWDNLPPRSDDAQQGNRATGELAQTRNLRGNGPGPRVQEARPWEATNTDGSTNLGSYEVLAAVGMTELAHELMLARAAEAGHQVFSLDTMRRLARTLLVAADQVQAAVRSDGHTDRMDTSHNRARGAVRTALEAYPVPWDAGADEKAAWVADLVRWATEILACALELAQTPAAVSAVPTAVSAAGPRAARSTPVDTTVTGALATDDERNAALAATRAVDDSDVSRDRNGDTAYDRLAHWMHANGVPPLISKKLTSDQALKVRAYLANADARSTAA